MLRLFISTLIQQPFVTSLYLIFFCSWLLGKSLVHATTTSLFFYLIGTQKSLKGIVFWKELGTLIVVWPLAIVVSLFSYTGATAAQKVLTGFAWPLVSVLGYYFCTLYYQGLIVGLRRFNYAFGFGLVLGFIYLVLKHQILFFEDWSFLELRLDGTWDIIRWGIWMGFVALVLIFFSQYRLLYANFVLIPLSLLMLFLSQTRTALMSFVLASAFYSIKSRKALAGLLLAAVSSAIFLMVIPSTQRTVLSVFDIKKGKDNQALVSNNASNLGRLNMWKVAVDALPGVLWFGTGFESTEAYLRAFIAKQSPEYQDRYTKVEYSYRDQHNSYLNVLFQFGLIFSIYFWSIIIGIIVRYLKYMKTIPLSWEVLSLLLFYLISFIPNGGITSYESIPFYFLLGTMLAQTQKAKAAKEALLKAQAPDTTVLSDKTVSPMQPSDSASDQVPQFRDLAENSDQPLKPKVKPDLHLVK